MNKGARPTWQVVLVALVLACLAGIGHEQPLTAYAAPTTVIVDTTCTENHIKQDLASASNVDIRLNCTPALADILFSSPINITRTATIEMAPGGSAVTLDGQNSTQLFTVAIGGSLTLNLLTLSRGHGSGSLGGGAIYNQGTLTVQASTLSGNSYLGTKSGFASGGGGAIENTGTLTVQASTLSGNSVSGNLLGGGAIYNSFNGILHVTTSTLSGNSVIGSGVVGGAISTYNTTTIAASTLSGNSATGGADGGALYSGSGGGVLHVRASIVAGNMGNFNREIYGNVYTNDGNNVVGPNSGPGDTAAAAGLVTSGLANNGGPTQTIALDTIQSNNPAIDRFTPCLTTYDQRGFLRPVIVIVARTSTPCDIGAYEASAVSPLVDPFLATPEAPSDILFGAGIAVLLLSLGWRSRRRRTPTAA